MTRNGRAVYMATRPDPETERVLMAEVCAAAGVRPVLEDAPPGVQAVRRGNALVLLNHGTEAAEVTLPSGTITLPGRDVRVLPPP